ncbi:MAG: hypothetical protein HZC41_23830 [Chloroflexi bacterium]|nr:hypothetical protein [Chloroflexota bacterium]
MKRLMLICVLVLGVSAAAAQETISPALETHLEAIEQVTAQLRDLDALTPVEHRFPTREDVTDYLERELNIQLDAETLRRETQFYIAFDLLPSDVNLREVYLNFLTSPAGVAGFYDTDSKAMNVLLVGGGELGDRLPLLDQITYSHEFTHALQDQHFDLDSLLSAEEAAANPDAALARLALVEGDATAVMTSYLQAAAQQNPMAALGLLAQGFTAGAFSIPRGTPPFIVTELTFPYQDGMAFVNALYRDGGWDAVNAAYDNLPQSSEQILHPDRYLAGDTPQAVTLETVSPGEEWALLADRTLGEFYLRAYLDTQLSPRDAARAAAGWGGDRYHLYYNNAADQRAFVLQIAWDTPEDADEFRFVFDLFGEERYGGSADDGCWSDGDSALCLAATADNHTVITSAPTLGIARGLLSQ